MKENINKILINKIKDFVTNILASVVLTGMIQVIVYPMLGKYLSSKDYGEILILMGIVNTIGASIGGPLNNTKILMNNTYEKFKVKGDYNIIALICSTIIFISTLIIIILIRHVFTLEAVILGLTAMFVFFRAYYSAAYRIEINFKKILYGNIFGVIGYIIGINIFYFTNSWYWIFFCGEFVACLYIGKTSFLIKEPLKKTFLFNKMMSRYSCYFFANSLSYTIAYMDRFFLFPILGAESVSIYSTASILGKIAGIIMIPISGVLLTYYCKEFKITLIQFWKRIGIYFSISIVAYIGISLIGYPILNFLYPTLAPIAKPYFYVANLGAIILLLGDTIMPTLLRYAKPYWSPIIQLLFAISYVLLGAVGMKLNSLLGFCYAIVVVNTIRLFAMVIVSFITIKKYNKKLIEKENKND